jgi:hypothetical protein
MQYFNIWQDAFLKSGASEACIYIDIDIDIVVVNLEGKVVVSGIHALPWSA